MMYLELNILCGERFMSKGNILLGRERTEEEISTLLSRLATMHWRKTTLADPNLP